jgi:protein involved in polysaccharide export with SLBB domain
MLKRFPMARSLAALCLGMAVAASAQDIGAIQGLPGFDRPFGEVRGGALMADIGAVFEPVDEKAYIVGPGDMLYVAMGIQSYKLIVSPDGSVIIDGFPPVKVSGKTLAEARTLLLQTFRRYYKGGDIFIALAQGKQYQVSVTGAVGAPGMYVAGLNSRLANVIAAAGGLSSSASQTVVIRKASGKETTVDLGAYFRDGDLSGNPYVAQGDQIYVTPVDYERGVVRVQSERGTRTVQIAPEDNVESIVLRASDFTNSLQWDHLNVFQDGRLVKRVERGEARSYLPPEGSTVEVRATQLQIFVGGAVNVPGAYPYNPTFTILDYISRAGITYNTANAKKATVIDAKGDVRKVNATKESPRPGDHIIVPRSGEAKTRDWVNLTASVSSLIISIVTLNILINQQ